MSCDLNKYTTYDVGRVVKNKETGALTATLVRPPASCPDGTFSSKKATLRVIPGNPTLSYDLGANKALISVPTASYVEQVGSSGFGLFWVLILGLLACFGVWAVIRTRDNDVVAVDYSPRQDSSSRIPLSPRYSSGAVGTAPVINSSTPGGGTTIVNNGSNNNGFVEGMILNEMMHNHAGSYHTTERIIEREVPATQRSEDHHTSTPDYSSSDNDDRSSSYSSDSGSSSYSSDSSSSYSSDSGSSFSSDSSSSFGSD